MAVIKKNKTGDPTLMIISKSCQVCSGESNVNQVYLEVKESRLKQNE